MGFTESVELIVPVRRGELGYCAQWLFSLQLTCKANDVYVTLVDVDGCTDSPDAFFLRSSPRIAIISCPDGVDNLSRARNAGVELAKQLRPDSYFYAFSHADVIGVVEGWLDQALDVLLEEGVGCVGFVPGASVDVGGGTFNSYVDDWLMLTKRDVLDRVGPFPETLASFGGSMWFYGALSRMGFQERLISAPNNQPMVAHARMTGYLTGGRRVSSPGRDAEVEQLGNELHKLWDVKTQA